MRQSFQPPAKIGKAGVYRIAGRFQRFDAGQSGIKLDSKARAVIAHHREPSLKIGTALFRFQPPSDSTFERSQSIVQPGQFRAILSRVLGTHRLSNDPMVTTGATNRLGTYLAPVLFWQRRPFGVSLHLYCDGPALTHFARLVNRLTSSKFQA